MNLKYAMGTVLVSVGALMIALAVPSPMTRETAALIGVIGAVLCLIGLYLRMSIPQRFLLQSKILRRGRHPAHERLGPVLPDDPTAGDEVDLAYERDELSQTLEDNQWHFEAGECINHNEEWVKCDSMSREDIEKTIALAQSIYMRGGKADQLRAGALFKSAENAQAFEWV